ncbi:UDP-N-acetylmuramoylalanyl-D-glutamate--2,6-diaminopimelate ligase [Mariprofundus ferrinatatus]|uniref:UDP-N-acetylmuramoylalanyl-D-glutamate--2, 6-diaminopimelate ligase n=1 Tax=Mariprofundus ferrinatatus TaxID=1921087 RepID=A0A2K8L626_9PROT|nr:UDP-N-acetylmuramoyl-L-alanyl-D-glutamate--2,6-diaminopimelate ligase [Mariprofundus ferrinatatus]ATX82693.1 UDP-N-acetylmuramoylalanyl-D-glutamate--2,6-diaminopimelate ligase [Mariprofundus ferrinatatus]
MSNQWQPHAAELAEGLSLIELSDGLGHLDLGDSEDVMVMGVCDDSRHAMPGYAMLCLPRSEGKATQFAESAKEQGAIAIISVGVSVDTDLPHLHLESIAEAGLLLRRMFKTEQASTHFYGITGTDGKTSVAWMLREALARYQSAPIWSSGTLGWMRSSNNICDIGNTTPSLLTMHAMLNAACQEGVHAVVSEISSHGIAQGRIAGLNFKTAIWTNMGHDHLQDHGGYEPYLATKAGFISDCAAHGGSVVANADHADIRERAPESTNWYGHGLDRDDVNLGWEQELPGLLRLSCAGEEVVIEDIPIGDFHAENVACVALTLMVSMGIELQALPELLTGITAPPGRMQDVAAGYGQVFIDYAHTPEALERCLKAARKLVRNRLIVVFGCGGERDREKRPQMGGIAAEFADAVWITSDNPRGELPAVIASEIEAGMAQPYRVELHLQLDREQAIAEAVEVLAEGDILVIAGKGHEAYMEVCGRRMPWSDAEVAERYLHRKHPGSGFDGERLCA